LSNSESVNRLQVLAMRYITECKSTWADIVMLATALHPKQWDKAAKRLAEQTGGGALTIKRKFKAVAHGISKGFTIEALIARGQEAVMSAYARETKIARTEQLVAFPHRLTPSVRDGLQELYLRIGKVLKLKTYDEVTEFIIADYLTTTDEEIVHRGGESNAKEKQASQKRA